MRLALVGPPEAGKSVQPPGTCRASSYLFGVGLAMLLVVEAGPRLETVPYGHLFRPQAVTASGARYLHRCSKA